MGLSTHTVRMRLGRADVPHSSDEQASAMLVPSSHRKGPSTFGGLEAGAEASGMVGREPDKPTLAPPFAIAILFCRPEPDNMGGAEDLQARAHANFR